ncbi:hypothetical protein TNCV_4391041 [Trichonephila clavipes]|nr:hypothetical protein TNCV_4391041 [Trichonephila clavipes]
MRNKTHGQEEAEAEEKEEICSVARAARQIVKGTAGEESLGHKRTPSQGQRWHHQCQAVEPDYADRPFGFGVCEEDGAVPWLHRDDQTPFQGDGRQRHDGHQSQETTQSSVSFTPCNIKNRFSDIMELNTKIDFCVWKKEGL